MKGGDGGDRMMELVGKVLLKLWFYAKIFALHLHRND